MVFPSWFARWVCRAGLGSLRNGCLFWQVLLKKDMIQKFKVRDEKCLDWHSMCLVSILGFCR